VHGDSFFSKKYVILDFMDEEGEGGGYTGKKVFEITKKEHMGFCDAAIKLYENSDGYLYLQNVDIIDRGQYLRKFGGRKEAVTDELLAQFEEDAREGAPSWADDNRHYALHN
jgi:hypothetical protein